MTITLKRRRTGRLPPMLIILCPTRWCVKGPVKIPAPYDTPYCKIRTRVLSKGAPGKEHADPACAGPVRQAVALQTLDRPCAARQSARCLISHTASLTEELLSSRTPLGTSLPR